jgi:hypothetical protein
MLTLSLIICRRIKGVHTTSEILVISTILYITFACIPFSITDALAELSRPSIEDNNTFLDSVEDMIQDDSPEVSLPEKGVFERLTQNNNTILDNDDDANADEPPEVSRQRP